MENVLRYYEFSDFFKDESGTFSGNNIAYTELNSEHFLIFEQENENYNLYVSKFSSKNEIGKSSPEILETLVNKYDKSKSEHRVVLRKYLY
ncbi:hypothetical protein [Tenacibaculum geojense]|uniref:Uncharacterized protein n=1 Tax=Tenacibaculum geojense TaxID=915352 RepID=A0ABW3JV25_9FLAO